MAPKPQGAFPELPDEVLEKAAAELERDGATGVERLARAGCVVLLYLAKAELALRKGG